jgi:hypothetical protein
MIYTHVLHRDGWNRLLEGTISSSSSTRSPEAPAASLAEVAPAASEVWAVLVV